MLFLIHLESESIAFLVLNKKTFLFLQSGLTKLGCGIKFLLKKLFLFLKVSLSKILIVLKLKHIF